MLLEELASEAIDPEHLDEFLLPRPAESEPEAASALRSRGKAAASRVNGKTGRIV